MKSPKRKTITTITNSDLEKDFKSIKTTFSEKETEENWTDRVNSLTRVEEMLNANNANDYKKVIAEKLSENITGIMQSIFSMRSAVALMGFSLISTISDTIGEMFSRLTTGIILSNLIDRSKGVSWLSKLNETTVKFLSHTQFHPSMFSLLEKKAVLASSKQLELCCVALKTIMITHETEEYFQITMEGNLTASSAFEYVLQKGLENGHPGTKSVSKEIFSIYNKNWPDKAKIFKTKLSPETVKRLPNGDPMVKQSTIAATKKTSPLLKQQVSLPKQMIPKHKQTTSESTSTTTTSSKQTIPKAKQITTTSKKLTSTSGSTAVTPSTKANSSKPSVFLQSISTSSIKSAPATTRSHELKMRPKVSIRRTNSEYSLQSSIAAKNLLNKLKSTDANTRILGIQILADRLRDTPYSSSKKSALPTNVPKKVDLLPLLMDFLSRKNLKPSVCEKLMSWDSIAGIFVRTLSIRSYCPTLIIADERKKCGSLNDKEKRRFDVYSQGLKRVKMFLKRNDSTLALHLLSILKSVMSPDQKALDASVKLDLQLNASYQPSLEFGLLKWMNELIQDYVGLSKDEDAEVLSEGYEWLTTESDVTSSEQWFQLPTNIQTYTEFVIQQLLETNEEDDKFGLLCSMLRSLKMGNEKVFETQMKALEEEQAEQIKAFLSSNNSYLAADEDDEILSNQDLGQKRKREESLSLEFSVEADGDNEEEERRRKVIKVEHSSNLPGANPVELKSFEFDSFEPETTDKELMEDKVVEVEAAGERCVKEKSVEAKVIEEEVVEEEAIEAEVIETEVIKAKAIEAEVIEAEVIKAEVIEAKVNEAKVNEPMCVEAKAYESNVDENKSAKSEVFKDILPTTSEMGTSDFRVGMKRKLDYSFFEVQADSKRKNTSMGPPSVLAEKKALDHIKEETDQTLFLDKFLADPKTVDEDLLQRISKFSKESWTDFELWEQKKGGVYFFFLLIRSLAKVIDSQDSPDHLILSSIDCIEQLLTNQSQLLEKIDSVNISAIYSLAESLVKNVKDYDTISKASGKAFKVLLRKCPADIAVKLLWSLTNDSNLYNASNLCKEKHPIALLFKSICENLPRVPKSFLEYCLKDGAAAAILKGFNHPEVTVRQACVSAAIAIYKILGQSYIKRHLKELRSEQLRLLELYIEQIKQ